MKRFAFLLVLFLAATTVQAKHVDFFEGSWDELKAKAAEEGKPFFVDVYTDWCHWCKVMDKKTFQNPDVAEYANEHYIAYKLNAEKGRGPKLARKFGIRGFPTVVLFKPNGEKIKNLVGMQQAEPFLAELKRHEDAGNKAAAPAETGAERVQLLPNFLQVPQHNESAKPAPAKHQFEQGFPMQQPAMAILGGLRRPAPYRREGLLG